MSQKMDEQTFLKIEELLHASDMGPFAVDEILSAIKKEKPKDPYGFLFDHLKKKVSFVFENNTSIRFNPQNHTLQTIMVVGVNGAGKTTTIGKLAFSLKRQGAKVVVGAADTFRAAAVQQLQGWCDKANIPMVKADKETTPPSAVGFSTLARGPTDKSRLLHIRYCRTITHQ